ncbi:30S ribosomal protein S20 [Puia dinghuensis]|nr:30S ribosomal protein S20 [Puia dinghuensis]
MAYKYRPKKVAVGYDFEGFCYLFANCAAQKRLRALKEKSVFSWKFPQIVYLCRPKNAEFMANHKATKKDVRQAEKRRDRNRYYGKTTRNAIRDLRAIKEQKEAGEKMPEVASMIDKLAKKGVIHKNKAANLKSKLARKVNSLAAAK